MTEQSQDYNVLQSQLMDQNLPITAAEIQGILTGLYVTGLPLDTKDWRTELFKFTGDLTSMPQGILNGLSAIQSQLTQELKAEQVELTLFLPDDEDFIIDRAEALVYWCQGFNLSVQATLGQVKFTDEECQEAWQDLKEICHLDLDSISDNEADEQALFSLTEHIKISVLMLFQYLYRPPQTSTTLH